VRILRRFGREIRKKLPVDPVRQLQVQLNRAVKEERYEEAARLRDEIEKQKPE
jgi:protein-arginine kinase activator protein McsA